MLVSAHKSLYWSLLKTPIALPARRIASNSRFGTKAAIRAS